MERIIPQSRTAHNYKEAKDCFDRAVAILEFKRGGTILPSESAALYYAFMLLNDDGDSDHLSCVWDEVCEAGKLAASGYGVREDTVRPIVPPMTPGE